MENGLLQKLEDLLPAYLLRKTWFTGKKRTINKVTIAHYIPLPLSSGNAFLLLAEVAYESGLPEMYQLALTIMEEEAAHTILENCPEAIMAHIKKGEHKAILCDAYYTNALQQFLMAKMADVSTVDIEGGKILFRSNPQLQQHE